MARRKDQAPQITLNHIGFALNEIDASVSGFVSIMSARAGGFKVPGATEGLLSGALTRLQNRIITAQDFEAGLAFGL